MEKNKYTTYTTTTVRYPGKSAEITHFKVTIINAQ